MKDKEIKNLVKLRVAEASQDDAYKGIARIDYDTMKLLGLRRGDVISIKGGRETVAIVDRSYPADVGEGIVRVDYSINPYYSLSCRCWRRNSKG